MRGKVCLPLREARAEWAVAGASARASGVLPCGASVHDAWAVMAGSARPARDEERGSAAAAAAGGRTGMEADR
ncbi:hypothetical protein E2C01_073019 [Portunus trituberculatus]|uniref:Uncharacterized protein n=1 Tax=Portunus trituberculatus TaxID=210409 RepID=A0A5B7I451_PORTR|nr:hypothetical protein [Portunus trituberculatus]